MGEPSTYQCRAWERRAVTIQLKAEALLVEMVAALGVEHEITDAADNVLHQAQDLADDLNRLPGRLKARRGAATNPKDRP